MNILFAIWGVLAAPQLGAEPAMLNQQNLLPNASSQLLAQEKRSRRRRGRGRSRKRSGGDYTESGKRVVERTVMRDSSEHNREGKKVDLTVELIGFSVYPFPSAGITAGYYIDPDLVVEANYARGSINLFFFEFFSQVFSARVKRYWGNSFYTNLGLGSRTIGGKTTLGSTLGVSDIDAELSVTSLVADIAIGNKWQWQNFTLGCDWIGALVPLSKLSSKNEFPEDSNQEDKEKRENDFESIAVVGTAQILRFYLGIAF